MFIVCPKCGENAAERVLEKSGKEVIFRACFFCEWGEIEAESEELIIELMGYAGEEVNVH